MAETIDAARIGRRTYHREYQRLRREGKAPKAARRIAGRLGREASVRDAGVEVASGRVQGSHARRDVRR